MKDDEFIHMNDNKLMHMNNDMLYCVMIHFSKIIPYVKLRFKKK